MSTTSSSNKNERQLREEAGEDDTFVFYQQITNFIPAEHRKVIRYACVSVCARACAYVCVCVRVCWCAGAQCLCVLCVRVRACVCVVRVVSHISFQILAAVRFFDAYSWNAIRKCCALVPALFCTPLLCATLLLSTHSPPSHMCTRLQGLVSREVARKVPEFNSGACECE